MAEPDRQTAGDDHVDPQRVVRIVVRPMASPLPLGFVGLAGGTIALSAQQLGWVPAQQSHMVAVAALLMAVPLQLVASLVGFPSRDPAAATAMGTLAVSWATVGVLTLLGPPGSRSPVLGVMLLFATGAVLVSAVVAAPTKGLVAVVLLVAAVRFAVTGVYEYVGGRAWELAAGWIGLALCVLAVYAALAMELESMRKRPVLPTLRHGAGRAALAGADGLGPVHREAGVREQL